MHILFGHLASASGGHRRKRLRLATVMAVFALVVFLTVCTQGLARNSLSKYHHGAAPNSVLAPGPAVHGYSPVVFSVESASAPVTAAGTDGPQGDDAWLRESDPKIAAAPAVAAVGCTPLPLSQQKKTWQDRSRPPPEFRVRIVVTV
jgi:hypothetical protein